jgi:hypothetical protein
MKTPTTWTTRNGEVLQITAMTTSHLENTVRFLQRNAPALQHRDRKSQMDAAERVLAFTSGEMACHAIESAIARLMNDDTPSEHWLQYQPHYRALTRELRRRQPKLYLEPEYKHPPQYWNAAPF